MSAQDKIEQVLRDMHILLSRSEAYDQTGSRVIVDKKEMLKLLQRLNLNIYELMEERELTQQKRAAAEREFRRKSEEIVSDAHKTAEDVYAGAVLYTDEALRHVQDIMQEASDAMKLVYEKMNGRLQKQKAAVQRDQSELKGHLEDLRDTNKYLNLIEERNKQLKKKHDAQKQERAPQSYAAAKPEIRVNMEYFEKAGIAMQEPEREEFPEEETKKVTADVRVNLDSEYFKRKDETMQGEADWNQKKTDKPSLFGKILKGDK